MNLIENVWSVLKNKVYEGGKIMYNDKATIKARISEEWQALNGNFDFFENLYKSMPKRITKVINANGGNIK